MFAEGETACGAGVPGRNRVPPSKQRGPGAGGGRAPAAQDGVRQHRAVGGAAAADAAPR